MTAGGCSQRIYPLHAAGPVLPLIGPLALSLASDWSRLARSHAAAVSQGTAANSAAAFDLHWENQSGIKDRRETGNTFLLATAWQQPNSSRQKVLNAM